MLCLLLPSDCSFSAGSQREQKPWLQQLRAQAPGYCPEERASLVPIQPHLLWVLNLLCSRAGTLQTPGQGARRLTKGNWPDPSGCGLFYRLPSGRGHLRSWARLPRRHQAYLWPVDHLLLTLHTGGSQEPREAGAAVQGKAHPHPTQGLVQPPAQPHSRAPPLATPVHAEHPSRSAQTHAPRATPERPEPPCTAGSGPKARYHTSC